LVKRKVELQGDICLGLVGIKKKGLYAKAIVSFRVFVRCFGRRYLVVSHLEVIVKEKRVKAANQGLISIGGTPGQTEPTRTTLTLRGALIYPKTSIFRVGLEVARTKGKL
jgi:hypothetical protein